MVAEILYCQALPERDEMWRWGEISFSFLGVLIWTWILWYGFWSNWNVMRISIVLASMMEFLVCTQTNAFLFTWSWKLNWSNMYYLSGLDFRIFFSSELDSLLRLTNNNLANGEDHAWLHSRQLSLHVVLACRWILTKHFLFQLLTFLNRTVELLCH